MILLWDREIVPSMPYENEETMKRRREAEARRKKENDRETAASMIVGGSLAFENAPDHFHEEVMPSVPPEPPPEPPASSGE